MKKTKFIKNGFTLLELLVVISIIGIMISLGAVSFTTAQKKSRDAKRKADMKQIQNALEQCYSLQASYPTSGAPWNADNPTLVCDSQTIASIFPQDPKNSDPYLYTISYDSDGESYCACANLELGGGNATTGATSSTCSFGTDGYFCVQNLQ